ncbi:putative allantoate permease [Hyphopichia burtonii NRRL Y-1933]|uniref:Putative allantoate permease n=1 Tax=Hyphopichia burtonii NRRL Y-1933 TaxID=984485 RepID=A0A1E4RFT3_9ASCO|nr:putative allantoate permease [Hyphopichia burtonii NRRL Y-1933]ODV66076.1 putative allantoate permease [Hyphopichia burtonii NRRL Y-1933]
MEFHEKNGVAVNVKSSGEGSQSIDIGSVDINFDIEKHPEEVSNGTILKKLDRTFMIPMLLVYTLQFLDKVVLNYAKVMGMADDLKLVENQFTDLPTYFFVAYIIAELFNGFYVLPKFPVATVLSVNVCAWGLFTACCAACTNYRGILTVRILLGLAESVVIPAMVILSTNFYSKAEQAFRIGIWYSGLGFGQIFGGIISYLFQLVGPGAAVEGWRIMFIVIGLINIIVGVYIYFYIPSTPLSAKMLTAKEKFILLQKLTESKIGVKTDLLNWKQIWELVTDIQAWLLFLVCATISFSSNTISTFSATDIISFGFDSKEAALLNMPSGVVSILSSCLSTYFIMKGFTRYLAICILLLPAVTGGALMSFLPKSNQAGLLIGIYMINTVTAPLAICYSWAGANFAGSLKKIGINAIFISCGFALANIVSPKLYNFKDAPNYYPAKISMLATQAGSIFICLLIAFIYYLRNKQRDREQDGKVIDENEEVENVWLDLTDHQNRSFRYCY